MTFLAITETWLSDEIYFYVDLAKPPMYEFLGSNRKSLGGGIGIFYLNTIKMELLENSNSDNWEFCVAKATLGRADICIIVIYRCPKGSFATFLDEYVLVISYYLLQFERCIIMGDFNVPVNKMHHEAFELLSCMEELGFYKHNSGPTHVKGNELDLVFSNNDVCKFVEVDRSLISDHFCITFQINFTVTNEPQNKKQRREKWLWDRADYHALFSAIVSETAKVAHSDYILQSSFPELIINEIFDTFQNTSIDKRREFVNCKHKIIQEGRPRYFDAECESEKRLKRKLERVAKKHPSTENRLAYKTQVSHYRYVLSQKRNDFYSKNFASKSPKMLFYSLNELMNHTNEILPSYSCPIKLANEFNQFFSYKVRNIVMKLPVVSSDLHIESTRKSLWSEFCPITPQQLHDVCNDLSNSVSPVDIVPAIYLKKLIGWNVEFFTDLINCVLTSGVFPNILKTGVIRPLLKPGLDKDVMNSYRPITNLPSLSKVIEKQVLEQLNEHLTKNNLWPKYQSAYRKGYSTETGLLYCSHKIYSKIDSGKSLYVISLDFSAAFDTIDHQLLLTILEQKLGLTGTVKQLFESYLKSREVQVMVDGKFSDKVPVETGVPQGSVIGPILFSLYLLPLFDVLNENNIPYHFYADDSQLFIEITSQKDNFLFLEKIEELCSQLHLSLNKKKTIINFFGRRLKDFIVKSINAFGEEISLTTVCKILGVLFDYNMTFEKQVNKICKLCYLELRKMYTLKRFLDLERKKTFVTSFILSRLDYCNSLFLTLKRNLITKLQRVQNAAARFVLGVRRSFTKSGFTSSRGLLKKLHWLPIEQRIKFKACCIMFRVFHNWNCPDYLLELFTKNIASVNPSRRKKFVVPKCRTELGKRSFSYQGAVLWNSLPSFVTDVSEFADFKRNLKTFFFCQAF